MNAFIKTLPGVFDAIEASVEVRDAFVFAAWRYVAGEKIAERTSPLQVDGKKLIVTVEDKTWKRNLESLAPQLLFKLNASLGRSLVDLIEFRISPAELPTRERAEDVVDGLMPMPEELAAAAERIQDRTLRQNVLKAAGACLSRKHSYSYLESDSIN
jgi:hypothetical protein